MKVRTAPKDTPHALSVYNPPTKVFNTGKFRENYDMVKYD